MASSKKPAASKSAAKAPTGKLADGTPVSFNYRSAKGVQGTVVGVKTPGRTSATTMYEVMPAKTARHPGEKLPIHRTGAHLRKRG